MTGPHDPYPGSDPNPGNDPYPGSNPQPGDPGRPNLGKQPEYGSQPQYGNQPQYGSQPGGEQGYGSYPPPTSNYPNGGYGDAGYAGPPQNPKNGLGIAALVLGILSILTLWTFGFGILLGIVAIVLGVIARGRAKKGVATNKGVSTTGVVLGALGVIAGIVFIALVVWVFNEAGVLDYATCVSDANGNDAAIEQCNQQFNDNLEQNFDTSVPLPTN